MSPTYKDVIKLCRKYNVLGAWRDEDICYQLDRSITENCLAFELDSDANLISICLGYWHKSCSMHIVAIAGPKGSLRRFISHLKKTFPQVTKVSGMRSGKIKEFPIK